MYSTPVSASTGIALQVVVALCFHYTLHCLCWSRRNFQLIHVNGQSMHLHCRYVPIYWISVLSCAYVVNHLLSCYWSVLPRWWDIQMHVCMKWVDLAGNKLEIKGYTVRSHPCLMTSKYRWAMWLRVLQHATSLREFLDGLDDGTLYMLPSNSRGHWMAHCTGENVELQEPQEGVFETQHTGNPTDPNLEQQFRWVPVHSLSNALLHSCH